MAKKRKSVATRLDEVDRTMYSTFCSAASSLSQLYTQAQNQQKISFQAGERHGLEKLYQWILRQQETGSRVTTSDILTYLQTDLECYREEPSSMSPRAPLHNQHVQATMQFTNPNSSVLPSSGSSGAPTAAHSDQQQSKNYVFSNALSSPVCQSLQNYHISQGGHYPTGVRNNEANFNQHQNRDSNAFNANVSSMDMH